MVPRRLVLFFVIFWSKKASLLVERSQARILHLRMPKNIFTLLFITIVLAVIAGVVFVVTRPGMG